MSWTWARKPVMASRRLVYFCVLIAGGCGGKGSETSDAVVETEPNKSVTSPVDAPTPPPPTGIAAPAPAPVPASPASPPKKDAAPSEKTTQPQAWGALKGRIVFAGEAPAPKILVEKGKAGKNPEFCAADAPISSDRLIVDGATKGVRNVLVYVPKPSATNPAAKSNAASAEVEFDQDKCVFKPHVLAVMAGATITLKNSDAVNHNINARLKENATNPNLSPTQTLPFVTQGPERVPGEVVCDIHPWMRAYWLVTDSPYFAVTNVRGEFEIKDLPAGPQKVVVWQESVTGGFISPPSGQEVAIPADGVFSLDLTLNADKIRSEE